jgi:hypothetical protein
MLGNAGPTISKLFVIASGLEVDLTTTFEQLYQNTIDGRIIHLDSYGCFIHSVGHEVVRVCHHKA